MKESPGGHAAAGQDRVARFIDRTVPARDARVAVWVFIAGCALGSVGSDDSSVMTASSPGSASTATLSASPMSSPAFWYKRIRKAPECGATGPTFGGVAT
jgi:hypothetical protein